MTARWKTLMIAAGLGVAFLLGSGTASAQGASRAAGPPPDVRLFDDASDSLHRSPQATHIPTPAELRQSLAWHQRLQRVARIEAALQQGYHLSRPPGVVTPSTTSRYPYYDTIYIPVYVDHLPR